MLRPAKITAVFGGDGGWRRALSGGGKELGVDNPKTPLQIFSASHLSPHPSLISDEGLESCEEVTGRRWMFNWI
ncbi:hypothetical protein MRB53_034836 [Persea americana]|uniref:Uncharacterized protein n=1 Tax=Persea americana TaxID=3435 RepID=A0ACC2K378_PERAE|nr:hypothetical protein MRB53_034836 [Persea americana]